jgi:hypothetical protein
MQPALCTVNDPASRCSGNTLRCTRIRLAESNTVSLSRDTGQPDHPGFAFVPLRIVMYC